MPEQHPTIVIYHPWPELADYIEQSFKPLKPILKNTHLNADTKEDDAEVICVFIDSFINKTTLPLLPNLKLVSTMGTGYDHIDVAATKKHGAVVSNVPTYGENTVAEHTFALILGLTRKLFQSVKRVKEGVYDFRGLRGVDLKDKTLGVIGTGHIGAHVIRMANGFGMKVIAMDAFPNQELAQKLGFSYVSLEELLKTADIVTLHTPLLKTTKHLINKKNIKLMKTGSFLINTARGGLIEPEAIMQGLKSEQLAGVGLDVLEDENLLQNFEDVMKCTDDDCKLRTSLINNLIINHPNAIVTPHNAFNSNEALRRIIDVTADNVKNFLAGKPQNLVK